MKDLTIHHLPADGDRSAHVRVGYRSGEGAPIQERETEFCFSLTSEERRLIQWYLEEYLLFPWGQFRDRAAQVERLLEEKGAELFNAVFGSPETSVLYAEVADDLPETQMTVLTGDPAGISLPWELMRDPARGDGGEFARLAYSFVRGQPDMSRASTTPNDADTLNILMVICRPGGSDGDVPFQSVARSILEMFRPHHDRVRLDVLRPPTIEHLAQVLADKPGYYHVLHFDGHGAFPRAGATRQMQALLKLQGQLMFEREDGGTRPVSGEELGKLLAGKGVQVMVLNACQSGMTYPEALYPSLGNQILCAGVGGVIAMAYSVFVETARQFMTGLYQELINGQELARAVRLAREGLVTHPERFSPVGKVPLKDWMVPVVLQAGPLQLLREPAQALRLSDAPSSDSPDSAGFLVDFPVSSSVGLIGRDGVVLEMERAFQKDTIVLLEGMAGVGKTETALGFARWRAETGARNGVAFSFDLGTHLPLVQICDRIGQVFSQAIHDLTGREWASVTPEQQRQLALVLLRESPCLLIWDNLDRVTTPPWTDHEREDLCDFLAQLRSGQTKVILTSRRSEEWLGSLYTRVGIGGLVLREAQELAYSVLRRSGMSVSEIGQLSPSNDLLGHLGGNPLVIQTVMPELHRMSPDALLAALQSGEALLDGDDLSRRRMELLTASLHIGLDALDTIDRQRLSLLGMFQRSVNAAMPAAFGTVDGAPELLRGLDTEGWARILDQADTGGLVKHIGNGHYVIHPILPWFLQGAFREAFSEELVWLEQTYVRNYAEYGALLVRGLSGHTQEALIYLNAEEGNLRQALHLARQHQQWESVPDIFRGLYRLLELQGRWAEWDRLDDEWEEVVSDREGSPLPGRESVWIGILESRQNNAYRRRDLVTAEHILGRLRKHYGDVGDEAGLGVCYHQDGLISYERQSFAQAKIWFLQSLGIKQHLGDEVGQAATMHELGLVAQECRQLDEAESWLQQALVIRERLQDEKGYAYALHALGLVAEKRDRFDTARGRFLECLRISHRLGDLHGQAVSLIELGLIAQRQGHLEESETWYRQSLAIRVRQGDEHSQALIMNQLGRIAFERQRLDEAEAWYHKSLELHEALGSDDGMAFALSNLGTVALERGLLKEAEDWLLQGLTIRERLGDKRRASAILATLGFIADKRGNSDQSKNYYDRAQVSLDGIAQPSRPVT